MSGTSEKAAATTTTTTSPKSKVPPLKEEVDAATQAWNHFAQGRRHLLVSDINSAVNSLQEACRMLAEQHGETANECGDAYFFYGRALLEMSRIESSVLGNALDGVPEGDDLNNSQVEDPDSLPVEEREKVAEQVGEALEENFKSLEIPSSPKDSKDKGKSEPKDDETPTDKVKDQAKDKADSAMDTDSGKKETTDGESQDESQEESQDEFHDASQDEESQEEGGEEKEGEKTEDADDVSNLQLAWEMLELAKVIYQRHTGDKEMSLKTAQVFLKLGEVCLENENFPQSIEDFQSCLKIQEAHMEADDRCLAETHYQLGVALSFSDDFDKAIDSFTRTCKIIEDRIANLEKRKTEKPGWTEEQKKNAETNEYSCYTEDVEIKELKDLILEVKEKIIDMEEMMKDAKDKINIVKKELGMASAIGGPSSSDAKMVDPTIIKKRKPEDETNDAPKKTKAVNGEAKSSPEKMDTGKDS